MYEYTGHDISIGDVKIGQQHTITVQDSNQEAVVKIAAGADCGLHFFAHSVAENNTNILMRVPLAGDPIDVYLNNNTMNLLVIDGGTASYTGNGCKVGLYIDGATVMANSTAIDSARPAITGIAMNNKSNNSKEFKLGVNLPEWSSSHGSPANTRIQASNDNWNNSDNWEAADNVTWSTSATSYFFDGKNSRPNLSWNSTKIQQNQALVAVDITPTGGQSPTTWWYYTEGK